MMDSIRQYLLMIISAAIFCSMITAIMNKDGTNAAILKLLTGLFMAITVISPLTKLDFSNLPEITFGLSSDAETAADIGGEIAENQMREIIKQQTEAYIQDKACDMGLEIKIDVELSSDSPPVPCAVTMHGSVSPYAKSVLCQYIENNLAVPEECQLWM